MADIGSMDAFRKKSTKTKGIISLLLLVVFLGAYGYVFYKPQYEEKERLKAELSKLYKELEDSKRMAAELERYKAEVEKMNLELAAALTQLPTEKEIPEILKNISSLGKESNLEFTLFRPKPEEPQQYYAKVPIELTMVGSYHNTGMFFDRVSKQPRIINVVDFNMTRQKEARPRGDIRDETVIRTSCLLNTYRYIEKKTEEKKSEEKKSETKTAQ